MKKIVAALCGLVLLVGLYGCWPSLVPPVAEFAWTVINGLQVNFDASPSYDTDGSIVSYTWQFGDGGQIFEDIGPEPSHVYGDYGTYVVQVTVTDNDGKVGIATHTVTLVEAPINHAPIANFAWTQNVFHVDFDGSESYDADNDIVDWFWTFGDGGADSGIEVDHNYPNEEGRWRITLTVVDDDGLSDSIQQYITLCNDEPQSASLTVSAPHDEINIRCFSYDGNTGLLVLLCENVSGDRLDLVDIAVHGKDAAEVIVDTESNSIVGIGVDELFELEITMTEIDRITNIEVFDVDTL